MYTARYWWMRSPNYWNANNTRIFNPSGALSNNNAYNTNGAAADCENSQFAVGFKPNFVRSHKELLTCPDRMRGGIWPAMRPAFGLLPL